MRRVDILKRLQNLSKARTRLSKKERLHVKEKVKRINIGNLEALDFTNRELRGLGQDLLLRRELERRLRLMEEFSSRFLKK